MEVVSLPLRFFAVQAKKQSRRIVEKLIRRNDEATTPSWFEK